MQIIILINSKSNKTLTGAWSVHTPVQRLAESIILNGCEEEKRRNKQQHIHKVIKIRMTLRQFTKINQKDNITELNANL